VEKKYFLKHSFIFFKLKKSIIVLVIICVVMEIDIINAGGRCRSNLEYPWGIE